MVKVRCFLGLTVLVLLQTTNGDDNNLAGAPTTLSASPKCYSGLFTLKHAGLNKIYVYDGARIEIHCHAIVVLDTFIKCVKSWHHQRSLHPDDKAKTLANENDLVCEGSTTYMVWLPKLDSNQRPCG